MCSRAVSVRMSTLFYGDPARDGLSRLAWDAVTTGRVTVYDGGRAERDILPLDAAADYLSLLARGARPAGPPANLASGRATRFSEVVDLLRTLVPDLEVDDRALTSPAPPVLARFDRADVDALGAVEARWEVAVREYVERLRG